MIFFQIKIFFFFALSTQRAVYREEQGTQVELEQKDSLMAMYSSITSTEL